ncbi:MAG: DEAD/DEAH box helicase, partial [Heyndrickxia sp.]
ALNQQIIREVSNDFWTKIGYDKFDLKQKQVVNLLPSNAAEVLNQVKGKSFILVSTIQSLQNIAKNTSTIFNEIKNRVRYLIFDEGHKEPAFTWGETVRSFNKPTILFSATPYRNDAKIFNFDKTRFFSLEHIWCEKSNILRSLSIKPLNPATSAPGAFVTALLGELRKITPELNNQGITAPKVVIRCEKQEEIKNIVAALHKLKKTTIGIHEEFKNEGNFANVVPTPENQKKYEFFVHQYKLVEGIDNPDFCVVALYSDFGSTRLLIQQIGRILRNPSLKPNQYGYLFTTNPVKIKHEWQKYLMYDQEISKRNRLFDISDVLKVNKDASTLYFSGTFRELVDVKNIELAKAILFQKKLNVFENPNLPVTDIGKLVVDEWSKRDFSILKIEYPEPHIMLLLYIMYNNSPLVKDGVFIEQKLVITYVEVQKDLIFCYDSESNNPFSEIESINPIPREKLIKLFNKKRKVTRTFLLNTDIGNGNLRSKDLAAASIESTAPGLADHGYFPSRMEAIVLNGSGTQKRYLGFQNGRITDFSAKRVEYSDFINWVKDVKDELNTSSPSNAIYSLMNRYAQKVDAPINTEAVSILLDLDQEVLNQYVFGAEKQDLEFEDTCGTVSGGKFTLSVNGKDFVFEIIYKPENKRYLISCKELEGIVTNIEEEGPSLLSVLNASQAFRIILKGNKHIYAYRTFFQPGLNLISKNRDLDLKHLFHKHPCITAIKSEKGNDKLLASSNQWHQNTLFGLIARGGVGYADKVLESAFCFDYVLCDDLGNEIADFIAIDEAKKKVVLIHVKAGKSKLSASSFQEICGQAVKNLDYLVPYYAKDPKLNLSKWAKPWSLDGIGTANRIVKGKITPSAFWKKYIQMIPDPSLSREVWLCVGNMLDYNAFEKEFKKANLEDVKPEAIQLVYLLRSTWNSVSSVGGQLKIYC